MAIPRTAALSMVETLDAYMEAFNAHDLDGVMAAFAENALYRPGSGVERVGRAAIRDELAPQFNLAFGAMRFDEIDRVIDERSRKIVIRYVCRHDLGYARPTRLAHKVQKTVVGMLLGGRFGWEGVDVFHFDEAGKILHKYTYAGYTRPRLEKSLGVPLPLPPWWARKT
jgi:hypothetical protein